MVTTTGEKVFYDSLERIYEELGVQRFFYAHKSYLVNYIHVTEFYYDRLLLSNGEIIRIAQSRRKTVRDIPKEYLLTETEENAK